MKMILVSFDITITIDSNLFMFFFCGMSVSKFLHIQLKEIRGQKYEFHVKFADKSGKNVYFIRRLRSFLKKRSYSLISNVTYFFCWGGKFSGWK